MIDKYELLKKYMKSRVGAPVVALCAPEECTLDEAVEAASTKYWTAMPYQTTDEIQMNATSGVRSKTIPAITDTAFGTASSVNKESAYFIGVGRYDESGLYNIAQSPATGHFDQMLLGQNFGSHPGNNPIQDPRYAADRSLLTASTSSSLVGEPEIRHDIVQDALIFILPPVQGTLHLWLNWGFCPKETIRLLPMVHFELFKKLCTFEFLEIIIAARVGITLSNADFQLDVSDLTSKRDSLKEELDLMIANMAIITGVWI